MAVYNTLTSLLTAIATAIRNKTGDSASINAQDFPNKIDNIITKTKTQTVSKTITLNSGGNTTFTFTFSNLKTVYGITKIQKISGSSLITTYSGYPDSGTGGNALYIPSGGISGNNVMQRFINNSDANNQSAVIEITAVGI